MGVHGLWKLLDAAGKPVPVETLENKVLAVDVSIWLHQLVKGFQDVAGGGANAHLLGLFYRICKLLFFRIKPVFVFDGGVPALKKRTIAARQTGRSKATESAEKHRLELLQNLLKQHAVGLLLGKDVPLPRVTSSAASKADRLYELPPIPSTSKESDEEEPKVENVESSSDDEYESKASSKYGDIHSIDVASKDFKSLPADMRHDILTELKETRKQNSWARLHLMPDESHAFSTFQMQRLLKRRSVQVGLEEAEKEMGPRGFTIAEIQEILEYQGVDMSQRIASDENTRFIYSALKKLPKIDEEKEDETKDSLTKAENLDEDSDADDPLFEAMVDQKGLTQEEILAMIKDQADKKVNKQKAIDEEKNKADNRSTDDDIKSKLIQQIMSSVIKSEDEETNETKDLDARNDQMASGRGEGSKNVNEPLDQIAAERGDNSPQAWKPGPGKISLVRKKTHFDDKAVTKLLRESANKGLLPISKVSLEPKKKGQKRKHSTRKVLSGPNLSESSNSDDSSDEKKVVASKRPSQISKKAFTQKLPISPIKKGPSKAEETRNKLDQQLLDEDDDLFKNLDIPDDAGIQQPVPKPLQEDSSDKGKSKNSSGKNHEAGKSNSVEIVLNFNEPMEDDDDIFKDIFAKAEPQKSSVHVVESSSSDNDFEEVNCEPSSSEQSRSFEQEKENIAFPERLMENKVYPDFKEVNYKPSTSVKPRGFQQDESTFPEGVIKSPVDSDSDSDFIEPRLNTRDLGPEPKFIEEDIKPDGKLLAEMDSSKVNQRDAILEEVIKQAAKLREEMGGDEKMISLEEKESKNVILYKKSDLDDDFVPEVESSPKKVCVGASTESKAKLETDLDLEGTNYFGGNQLALSPPKKSQSDLAAELLTVDQVRQFQSTLEKESAGLIREQRREERVAATVSEQITLEAQELLRLFGIPWIVAPMEAEAQCAYLDLIGLTQGTITDDSDIWLFGASNVYKNFFDQKKFVKLFKASDIKKVYNMGRDELIMIGLLVGSDYTVGLSGVGPVTALEIIANYPAGADDLVSPCDRLSRFANHMSTKKLSKQLAKKLIAVHLSEEFPSAEVVRAYTDPVIDESKESFSWGKPDIDKIREYAMDKFGWPADKTIKTLEPVFDKLKQDRTQTTLHGFFSWAFDDVQSTMSKRVEKAVNLLGNPLHNEENVDDPDEVSTSERKIVKPSKKKKSRNQNDGDDNSSEARPSNLEEPVPGPSSSSDNHFEEPGPSTPHSLPGPSKPTPLQKFTQLRKINQTIEMIKKGKMKPPGSQKRKVAGESSFLMKPHPLDMEGPFEVGEMPRRKKVARTDEEKAREIEEARAKAARVRDRLKIQSMKEDEF